MSSLSFFKLMENIEFVEGSQLVVPVCAASTDRLQIGGATGKHSVHGRGGLLVGHPGNYLHRPGAVFQIRIINKPVRTRLLRKI